MESDERQETTNHRGSFAPPVMDSSSISNSSRTISDTSSSNRRMGHELCSSCLWTGVMTCLGLSAYFAHIAFDDSESMTTTAMTNKKPMTVGTTTATTITTTTAPTMTTNQLFGNHRDLNYRIRVWLQQQLQQAQRPPSPSSLRYNKPVFLFISAGWLVVGAYRWHLG